MLGSQDQQTNMAQCQMALEKYSSTKGDAHECCNMGLCFVDQVLPRASDCEEIRHPSKESTQLVNNDVIQR